jgi:phage major head subunit gpT-like protein
MSLNVAAAITSLNALTAKFTQTMETCTPFWPRICTEITSNGSEEDYGMLGSTPGVREWLGDRVFNELAAGRFQIANREWEDSLKIKRTAIEDDKLGFYFPMMGNLAMEMMYHPDHLVVGDLLLNGDSANCIDGQYFFDTDHSWGDSGVQSNKITSIAADPNNPTLAEVRTALGKARTAIMRFKNDKGNLFQRNPIIDMKGIVAVTPPEMSQTMKDALIPVVIGTTPTSLINPPEVISIGQLTDLTSFYYFYTGAPLKPFVFQKRRPVQYQMKGLDDREFKDVKMMCDARYAAGFLAWWTAVKVTFSVS